MDSNWNDEGWDDPPAAPIRREDRLVALDLMRGIAVLGILTANITAFADVSLAYYWPPALPGGASSSDSLVWLAQFVLVDGKFRGLFSILFGGGLALFVDRISRFDRAIGLQVRRLFWLALFGLAHFFLLFAGDILFAYACAGVVAVLVLPLRPRTQILLGIGWALAGGYLRVVQFLPLAQSELGIRLVPPDPAALALASRAWAAQVGQMVAEKAVMLGSLGGIIHYRLVEDSGLLGGAFSLNFFETIPLMIIGMGLLRAGIYAPENSFPGWRGPARFALAAGLLANLLTGLFVWKLGFPPFATQLAFFGISLLANLPMLVGGTFLFARWAARPREGWLARRLVAAGRTAFTNYVGTSLVMALIFQGWALGLFGRFHRLALVPFVLLGWVLMLAWSKPWLDRFRYGPLEWLWRCLTYWRLFPLRR